MESNQIVCSELQVNSEPQKDENSGNNTLCRIYVRGISKRATQQSINAHFAQAGYVQEIIWAGHDNPQFKGTCKVIYDSSDSANQAVRLLNGSVLDGITLSVKLDHASHTFANLRAQSHKFNAIQRSIKDVNNDTTTNNKRDRDGDASTTLSKNQLKKQRKQQQQACSSSASSPAATVTYANDGLIVGDTFYPTPKGLYLMKLLELVISATCTPATENNDSNAQILPIINILMKGKRFNASDAKELTESMAMVTGIWRLCELIGLELSSSRVSSSQQQHQQHVTVYVLGDGTIPFTALLLMCYFMPAKAAERHWNCVSIDPLMQFEPSERLPSTIAESLTCVHSLSEEYVIENCNLDSFDSNSKKFQLIDIVVACHSHAPLQEFWDRLRLTRMQQKQRYERTDVVIESQQLCVSLPCCGKHWSVLDIPALEEYEDYEVISARRRVLLYAAT